LIGCRPTDARGNRPLGGGELTPLYDRKPFPIDLGQVNDVYAHRAE